MRSVRHLRSALDVEAELHDVAVRHDVVLALDADPAAGLRLGHRAGLDEIRERHDLRLDEASLEVGMDDTGGLGGGGATADRPGARLLRTSSEIRLQAQRREPDARELSQTRLRLAARLEELQRVRVVELDQLGLELRVQE